MPRPLPADKRAAVEQAIRDGHGTRARADIAREHGVAPDTVGRIAKAAGLDDPFVRTNLARATEAKRQDNRARRAEESRLALGELAEIRGRMREPADQVVPSGKVVTLDRPPARDVRDFAMAYQAMARTHLELDKHDTDDGVDDAKSMLRGLAEGLRMLYDREGSAG